MDGRALVGTLRGRQEFKKLPVILTSGLVLTFEIIHPLDHGMAVGERSSYNCSPSCNWKSKLNDDQIARFQGPKQDVVSLQDVVYSGFVGA